MLHTMLEKLCFISFKLKFYFLFATWLDKSSLFQVYIKWSYIEPSSHTNICQTLPVIFLFYINTSKLNPVGKRDWFR